MFLRTRNRRCICVKAIFFGKKRCRFNAEAFDAELLLGCLIMLFFNDFFYAFDGFGFVSFP